MKGEIFLRLVELFGDDLRSFLARLGDAAREVVYQDLSWDYKMGLEPRTQDPLKDLPYLGFTVRKALEKEWQDLAEDPLGVQNILLLRAYILWKRIPGREFLGDVDHFLSQKKVDIQNCCFFGLVGFVEDLHDSSCVYITGKTHLQIMPFFLKELGMNLQVSEEEFLRERDLLLEWVRQRKFPQAQAGTS